MEGLSSDGSVATPEVTSQGKNVTGEWNQSQCGTRVTRSTVTRMGIGVDRECYSEGSQYQHLIRVVIGIDR